MRHSIVRRSAGVTTAYLLGHGFNYALILVANQLLDAGGFSLFYTTILAITVVISPVIAVTFVIARLFTDVGAKRGQGQVALLTWRLIVLCLRWGGPAAGALGLALVAIAPWFGLEAWPILLLFPAIILALVLFEILRASFQSMLLFGRSSALWIVCQGAQSVLAVAGLMMFGKVWAGVAGIFMGAALTCAFFIPWFARSARSEAKQAPTAMPAIVFARELPMILSYSLFVLMNNIDILLGYWWLPRAVSDVYAASSLLPKAIVTATFPVAQVVLPVIVDRRSGGLSFRHSVLKAIAVVGAMSSVAAVALWLAVPTYQTTPIAIRGLDFPLMIILAACAVALSTLRVLVVVEVAIQRAAVGFAQAVPIILFIGACMVIAPTAPHLAAAYTIVSWGFLLCASLMVLSVTESGRARPVESAEQ